MLQVIFSHIYCLGKATFNKTASISNGLAIRVANLALFCFNSITQFFRSHDGFTINSAKIWTNADAVSMYNENIKAIMAGGYTNSKGVHVQLRDGKYLYSQSQWFPPCAEIPLIENKYSTTTCYVKSQDCLEMAQEYVLNGFKTVVLNFASPIEPGGGMAEVMGSQEEDICRRSELLDFMNDQLDKFFKNENGCFFPLNTPDKQGGLIHTSDVKVFRASRTHTFNFLDEPFQVGILSSPAIVKPALQNTNDGFVDFTHDEIREQVKILIRTQLKAAYENGYEALVLGAFGCGAFNNPPDAIAKIYHELINSEFKGAFKLIGFAILDDPYRGKHNPQGNLRPFQHYFSHSS